MNTTSSVHLTNAWHPTSGGVRTALLALLEAADREGREMTVVTPGAETSVDPVGRTTRIYTLRSPRVPLMDRRYRAILPYRYASPMRTAIWRILARHEPDIIEISDKYALCHLAGLIKRKRGQRPTLLGFSHERMDESMAAHLGRAAAVRLARWYLPAVYLRQFDAHLANSEFTADELRAAATVGGPDQPLLWRLRDRIHAVPPGADVACFSPARRSASLRRHVLRRTGGDDRSSVVVFAGRLSAEKHAMAIVPAVQHALSCGVDARLVVIGDGPLRAALARDAAARLPGRTLMLEHISDRTCLASWLASADAFLHPNPSEPFGLGPLEGMASGTPVILPGSGGVLTYASDQTAWLAKPGAGGLGDALVACLTRPDEARRRAEAGLDRARMFDWPSSARRYFDHHDRIHALRQHAWRADSAARRPAEGESADRSGACSTA